MADPKVPRKGATRPLPTAADAEGWSGRFAEPVSPLVKRYTASVDFDRRLAAADIHGSRAHARMLAAIGVLSAADLASIERGLDAIQAEIERGEFPPRPDEPFLCTRCGYAGVCRKDYIGDE